MPVFLLYADKPHHRNSTARNAALVNAADVASARTAAQQSAPDGETRNVANWASLELAAAAGAGFPASGVVWLGDVSEPLLPHHGR